MALIRRQARRRRTIGAAHQPEPKGAGWQAAWMAHTVVRVAVKGRGRPDRDLASHSRVTAHREQPSEQIDPNEEDTPCQS